MDTCQICGHDHGENVIHINRTVDGVTESYLNRVYSADSSPLERAYSEQPMTDIVNRAMLKLGGE